MENVRSWTCLNTTGTCFTVARYKVTKRRENKYGLARPDRGADNVFVLVYASVVGVEDPDEGASVIHPHQQTSIKLFRACPSSYESETLVICICLVHTIRDGKEDYYCKNSRIGSTEGTLKCVPGRPRSPADALTLRVESLALHGRDPAQVRKSLEGRGRGACEYHYELEGPRELVVILQRKRSSTV
ncbi:hypothetical protein BC827DRAFT_391022 [Russula dissimulans]|nr:hypothetical protein BC827DRAFT_391022 [Russula dissimulans]